MPDEALSPAFLRRFCGTVLERELRFRWACRCKLETSFDRGLFHLMRRCGCYEVLFGLESIAPATLKRMDKYSAKLDADRIRSILLAADDAGIGLHLNLIAGFPRETFDELATSIEFVVDVLRHVSGGTFTLNSFAVFPDTPVAKDPQRFGIRTLPRDVDMPMRIQFAPTQGDQERAEV